MTHVSDDFLNAHLDGEPLSPADSAHVEGCGTCQARLDQFRHVAAAVGAPVGAPAAHLREAAVAIALDEQRGATGRIRSLAARRALTKTAPRRMNALSAAAALVVALGVGGWLLSQVGSGGGDDKSTTNQAVAGRETFDGAGGGAADSSASLAGWHDAGDIGAFDQVAAVAAYYRAWEAKPEEERDASGTLVSEPHCPNPSDQPTVWQASLTFNGEPGYARLLFVSPSSRRLEVLRRTDCGVLASQAL